MRQFRMCVERVGGFVFAGVVIDPGGLLCRPAVAVHDDDFLAAVARHLVGGFLQQFQLELHTVGHRTGLVLRFKNLSEIIFWKNDGEFLLGGMQRRKANVEEIGSQRKMRSMLLQNAEREQARSFRLLNRRAKVSGGELFPFHGKLRLAAGRSGSEQKKESGHANSFHKPSWARSAHSSANALRFA